jgi:hypothetical protein
MSDAMPDPIRAALTAEARLAVMRDTLLQIADWFDGSNRNAARARAARAAAIEAAAKEPPDGR